jgi:phage baseplate assembly protein W
MSFSLRIINNDLSIQNGSLLQITGTDKLTQQILKICLTDVGANPLHPSYGSFLSRSVVGNPSPTSAIVQIATSQINTCLTNLQQIQQLQIKSFQQVSADEQLAAITGISVLRSVFDGRLFNVKIGVITKGLQPVTTTFTVNTI